MIGAERCALSWRAGVCRAGPRGRWLRTLSAGLALMATHAAAMAACTLVYGHGRNFVAGQLASNAQWDGLNQSFAESLGRMLTDSGRPALSMVLPVDSGDVAANAQRLLQRADSGGCNRVIEATVFGDPTTFQLVARLRVHPILRPAGAPRADADLVIGPAELTLQREMTLDQRALNRITSGALAQQLAPEILPHVPPPP